MKSLHIVFPIFLGTLIYGIMSVCIGPRSLWATKQLRHERDKVALQLKSLYAVNENLTADYNNLMADADTIGMYAHELGYVAKGERLIKLAGFSGGVDRSFETGSAVTIAEPRYVPEWICKICGFFSGLCSFFALSTMLSGRKSYDHRKKPD